MLRSLSTAAVGTPAESSRRNRRPANALVGDAPHSHLSSVTQHPTRIGLSVSRGQEARGRCWEALAGAGRLRIIRATTHRSERGTRWCTVGRAALHRAWSVGAAQGPLALVVDRRDRRAGAGGTCDLTSCGGETAAKVFYGRAALAELAENPGPARLLGAWW